MIVTKNRLPTFVVIGAGAMGRIIVKDLVESAPEGSRIVVADRDRQTARAVARANRSPRGRVKVATADVNAGDPKQTAALLREVGAFGVIAAVQHQFNLSVMEAALATRAHYCDLGGLFHHTRKQLQHDAEWKKADRLALLGIGAAPGIVNVLARSSADTMEEVHEIHVYVGGVDLTQGRPASPSPSSMKTSYSIQTILEEAWQAAAVFTKGRMTFVPALSGAVEIDFPAPVGKQRPAFTIHSELATLPRSYRKKGIRECTFRIAFAKELMTQLAFLRAIGLLEEQPLTIGHASIAPRDFLVALLRRLPKPPAWDGVPDEYEILRVVIRGVRDGASCEDTVDCHVPGKPEWKMGADIDTGCAPSIAMLMLARGEITARGCLPPERAVPAEPFFRELARRGMTVRRTTAPLA